MTATAMSTTTSAAPARGERQPIFTIVATMTTVVFALALMLVPTSATADLGISDNYQIVAGLVLMAGALLGAFNSHLGFVLGGYVYNVLLAGIAAFGLHEFQDGATLALLYTMFSAVLALVASIIIYDVRRRR